MKAGTDVMIIKIFSPKNFAKKLQNLDHNIWFLRKTTIFSAKNWQKSQKIVIITSTPGQN
jgi:hypothetical protein